MIGFENGAPCPAESRCRTRWAASDEWDVRTVVRFPMQVMWFAEAGDQ
jgi:hypothetical protein